MVKLIYTYRRICICIYQAERVIERRKIGGISYSTVVVVIKRGGEGD